MVDLDGQKLKTLLDSGSNVNILSEKTYSQYEQRSKLRPFREQFLSTTNDPFEILGVFTGEIMFDIGVKVKAELLVTPKTDVLLILGTQVMEENKNVNRLPFKAADDKERMQCCQSAICL